ncbi:MAG: hypothetical protein Q9217_005475 [Psora testacea]
MVVPLIPNVWHLRKVAERSAKACDICYKPTSRVLITPDNKDFFYLCLGHLKDRGFCSPLIDEAEAAAKKRKEEMEREIEIVKREYEVKPLKETKDEERKGKEKDDKKAKDQDEHERAEKEKNDKIQIIMNRNDSAATDDMPRIYALQKVFYQKRLDRIRNTEITKKNRERMRNPTLFPSVPSGNLG